MEKWKNLLLIAGTNRNVGKTTFACKVIEHFSKDYEVTAIKITPHFHASCSSCKIIHKEEGLIITKELSKNTPKDSSKMLAAGAKTVFYVQTDDNRLCEAISILKPLLSKHRPTVCESAALRDFINPGLFVVLSGDKEAVKNEQFINQADIYFNDFNFKFDRISFQDGCFGIISTTLNEPIQ